MAALLLLTLGWGSGADDTADEPPWWLDPQFRSVDEVNEGRLEFLPDPPDTLVHHHHHVLTISESSLHDGWTQLKQCHDHLDPVARAEIVFREGHVRNLSVDCQAGIGKAWIGDHSVELANIDRSSRLCLSAETRVMEADGVDGYVLRSGPFMRRFLDGYYPMQVTMSIRYPCTLVVISSIKPAPQPGFKVNQDGCSIAVDAWFEGRLATEIRFRSRSAPAQPAPASP